MCDSLPEDAPMETRTRVVLLVHPEEAKRSHGTMPLLRACLKNLTIKVDDHFPAPADDPELHDSMCADGYRCALVCPGPDASELRPCSQSEEGASDPRCMTLIFIDATWRHAKSMVYNSPWLLQLERVVLVSSSQSGYVFRQQPAEGCLSTLEAVAEALLAMEGPRGPSLKAGLLRPFHQMIKLQCRYIPKLVDKNAKLSAAPGRPFDAAMAVAEVLAAKGAGNEEREGTAAAELYCVVRWGEKSASGRGIVVLEVLHCTHVAARRRATELSKGRSRGNRCWLLPPEGVPEGARYEVPSSTAAAGDEPFAAEAPGAALGAARSAGPPSRPVVETGRDAPPVPQGPVMPRTLLGG